MRVDKAIWLGVWLLSFANQAYSASLQPDPHEVYKNCSQELHRCIKARKTTAETYTHNYDICWREVRQCPQICIDEYYARRKLKIDALDANPLYTGRNYEPGSCIPGMDEIKYPGRKLLPAESQLDLILEGPDKTRTFTAAVAVEPLDDKEKVAVTRDNPARHAHYNNNPLSLQLPAGRYWVIIKPLKDSSVFGEQVLTVALKKGQSLRRTVTFEPSSQSGSQLAPGVGTLHLVGPSSDNPVIYSLKATDKATAMSNSSLVPRSGLQGLATSTIDLSLPSGRYRLNLRPKNYAGGEYQEDIEIKPGKVRTQKIALLQPGRLVVAVHGLTAGQEAMMRVSSKGGGGSVLSTAVRPPSSVVNLAPGQYQATLYVPNKGPVYGPERVVHLNDIAVRSGSTLEMQANFSEQHWGTLKVNAMLDGKPVKAHVQLESSKPPSATIYPAKRKGFPETMPVEIALQQGNYLLSVWGEEPKDKAHPVFPQPRFERKGIPVQIKEGEVLAKTFTFKKQAASELTVKVLLNGVPSKARIKGRRAGSNGPFSHVGATYNLLSNSAWLLPGTYDLWVQPLEMHVTPGIDVFHGRKGQLVGKKLAAGTKPIILHNVEIKSDGTTTRTVRFESK